AQRTSMRLVGVIENMSGEVFGTGGGQRLADELGISLLGTIPLDPRLREAGDAGVQLVTPEIAAIAERVSARRPGSLAKPLHLVARHREQGEPVYIVSATLQEVVDGLSTELGFDGGIGTVCEVGPDGTYTGHSVLPLHGQGKAQAVVELARREDIDLARSTAYSDSHT